MTKTTTKQTDPQGGSWLSNDDKPLSKEDRDLVLRSANGFSKFSGDFIAKAGIGDLPSGDMSDADKERAQKLGLVQGFSIDYDLDRDGRDEALGVHFQQNGYWLTLKSQGITAQIANCFDGDTPNAVEVALKDINGDRRPEIFVAYETENTTGWGKFCILEFKGVPNLAERRRASTGRVRIPRLRRGGRRTKSFSVVARSAPRACAMKRSAPRLSVKASPYAIASSWSMAGYCTTLTRSYQGAGSSPWRRTKNEKFLPCASLLPIRNWNSAHLSRVRRAAALLAVCATRCYSKCSV